MLNMDYFAINGVNLNNINLPTPAIKGAVFSVQDIDSSETGRNLEGDMIRERVATKIKWQLTFPPLTRKMAARLLNAISEASFGFIYPDPMSETGTVKKTCYVGDRTAPAYSTASGMPMWENIAFSVIEI
jgi:hypothetical protein